MWESGGVLVTGEKGGGGVVCKGTRDGASGTVRW